MRFSLPKSKHRSWIAVVAFGLFLVLLTGTFLDLHLRGMERDYAAHTRTEATLLAALVQQSLQRQDYQAVDGFIRRWGMELDGAVVDIRVQTGNGFLLAHFKKEGVFARTVTIVKELSYSYRGRARLTLIKSLAPVDREHRRLCFRFAGVAFFVFVAFAFIVRINTRRRLLAQDLHEQKEELVRAHEDLTDEIRQRRQAQDELEREKELLAVTLRSIGDGVITTDIDGKVTLMNRVAERLSGWTQVAAAGRPLSGVFRVLHEVTRAPCPDLMEQVRQSGRAITLEERTILVARDGSELMVGDSAAPILDRTSTMIGAVVVFRDVTEEMRHRDTIARAQRLESVGLLAGGIAHDFNNILTGILGNIYLARVELSDNTPVTSRLGDAEQACQRARELTQQLITFARGGAPVVRAVEVAPLLEEAAGLVFSGSNVSAAIDVRPGTWAVLADGGQLHQVLGNLLMNAAQAMPTGGTVRIRAANVVPAEKPHRMVEIEVADEGGGIAPADMEKIFDPYFSTKAGGHGLGLAVVHSIVAKHGGHISVASEPGGGTRFTILLPVADNREEKKEQEAADGAHQQSGRILVMDDDDMARQVFARLLAARGYRVEAVRDGELAVAAYSRSLAAGEAFDAVIFDLTVPGGMGGVEALGILKSINPAVRALVSSGYSNDPILAEYWLHGFAGRIAKPCRPEDLYQELRTVLAGERSRDCKDSRGDTG